MSGDMPAAARGRKPVPAPRTSTNVAVVVTTTDGRDDRLQRGQPDGGPRRRDTAVAAAAAVQSAPTHTDRLCVNIHISTSRCRSPSPARRLWTESESTPCRSRSQEARQRRPSPADKVAADSQGCRQQQDLAAALRRPCPCPRAARRDVDTSRHHLLVHPAPTTPGKISPFPSRQTSPYPSRQSSPCPLRKTSPQPPPCPPRPSSAHPSRKTVLYLPGQESPNPSRQTGARDQRSEKLAAACRRFNAAPGRAIAKMILQGLLPNSPHCVAMFLHERSDLHKKAIGEYLAKSDEFPQSVLGRLRDAVRLHRTDAAGCAAHSAAHLPAARRTAADLPRARVFRERVPSTEPRVRSGRGRLPDTRLRPRPLQHGASQPECSKKANTRGIRQKCEGLWTSGLTE